MRRWSNSSPLTLRLALIALLALFAGPGAAFAGTLVVTPTTHDAGSIELGERIDLVFEMKNEHSEPVSLLAVRPQCGCTVADYDAQIMPGEIGELVAHVETAELQTGEQAKTITVTTNAPGAERVILTVKMNVVAALEFLPRANVFMRARPGQASEEKVLARPHREGMRITGVVSSNPVLKVSVEPVENPAASGDAKRPGGLASMLLPRAGDAWISVELPADAPEGIHRADVKVKTSDPEFPEVVLKVNAIVRSQG